MKFAKVLRTPPLVASVARILEGNYFFVVHVVLDLTLQTTLREHPASAVAEKLRIF